jgi:hypothetical protein
MRASVATRAGGSSPRLPVDRAQDRLAAAVALFVVAHLAQLGEGQLAQAGPDPAYVKRSAGV